MNRKTDSITNIKELYGALLHCMAQIKAKSLRTDKILNPTESPIYPMSGT